MSMPTVTNQQVHGSTSQLVPPELLVLCQQQAPYNPNFDSVSTASSNSSGFTSEYSGRRNWASRNTLVSSGSCGILLPSSWAHLRWFTGNFLLLSSLLCFNLGMLLSPQFYSNFFLIFQNHNLTSSHEDDQTSKFFHPILIDLLIASLLQIVLTLIATGSGLVLIYAACKVLATLRKRFQLSVKYRIHLSNQTPFPWFFITFERIAYETLGATFARMLSAILVVYLFGVSVLYVILLSDYLDMLLSLVTYDQIRQLFCEQHAWYLNHDFVISIWLSAVVLVVFGVNSFRRHNKHKSSLSLLKNLAAFLGAISVTYVICIVIYVFANSEDLSSHESEKRYVKAQRRLFPSSSDSSSEHSGLVCLKPNSTFDWTCLDKNWILLISSVPLLIMPFHLNELLITLLFASKQNQPLPTDRSAAGNVPAAATQQQLPFPENGDPNSSPSVQLSARIQSDRHPLAPPSASLLTLPPSFPRRFEPDSRSNSSWGQQANALTMLDDTIGDEPAEMRNNNHRNLQSQSGASEPVVQLTSLSSLFSRPLHSFTSVRNLFVSVTFFVCLINITVNAFVYISAFTTVADINEVHSRLPERIRERLEKSDDGLPLLDFNFLRNYLHFLEPTSDSTSGRQAMKRYLLIAACVCLLLKTTLTYLLLAFRATLAHRTMSTGTKRNSFGLRASPRTSLALSSFLFITPFLAWNFFVLLFSLFVERSPALLHLVLLVIGWLGIFLLFIYPALILLHFSLQSLQKNSLALTSSYALLSVAFKPLRWAKSCFLLGLCLLSLGLFYLVFWLYAYFQTAKSTEMSILPLIAHSNSSLLYCSSLTFVH